MIENWVRDVVASVPSKKVAGRKRLQKLIYLLKFQDSSIPATYRLHHYGPFSDDVAQAIEDCVFHGMIDEEHEPIGPYGKLTAVYRAPSSAANQKLIESLVTLDRFSTVELEIASTIDYFESEGFNRDKAIEQTKKMKPSKSNPRSISRAIEVLDLIRIQNERSTSTRSSP